MDIHALLLESSYLYLEEETNSLSWQTCTSTIFVRKVLILKFLLTLWPLAENRWHRITIDPPIPARAYHKAYYHKEFIYFIGGVDCTGKTVSKIIKFNLGMFYAIHCIVLIAL